MKSLFSYRIYRLWNNKQFWGIGIMLVVLSIALANFRRGSDILIPCVWGQPLAAVPTPTDSQFQSFYVIARLLSSSGYLFFVPSIICAFCIYDDLLKENLIPVVSRGYAPWEIHLTETLFAVGLNLSVIVLIHIGNIAFLWKDYKSVISWLGAPWLVWTFFSHIMFSVGDIALFILMSSYCARREMLLIVGLMCMAIDSLGLDRAAKILLLLPSGGIQGSFSGMNMTTVVFYFVETVLLVVLALGLPIKSAGI